jgi:separase
LPEVGILNDLVAAGAERRFNLIPQLQFDSQLWDAAYAFADLHRNNPTAETEALKSLKPLSISVACTNTSRAFAHYILGCSLVWKARQSGTLQELWNKSNVDHDDECPFLTKAQHHYKEAFYLLGSVCDLLKRNVTRCLALVTGPSDYSCALVLASIGTAIFPSSMYDEILTENENTFFDLLNAFNGIGSLNKESSRILHELANKSPTGWRYVASALCPTGEMLLASIDRKDNGESAACRVCCIFPTYSGQQSPCSLFPSSVFDEILKPLNEIMQQSRHQLLSALNTVADEEKHSYRREWWKGREDVDTRLRDLILATETRILTNPLARQILVGSEGSTAEDERANDENPANSAMANLASRFEAVSSDSTTFQLSNLKASELRDELLKRGFKSQKLRKMKKAELMELLVTQPEVGSVTAEEIDIEFCFRKEKINDEEDCIFLILDENLQRFPFESMLCFEDRTICRLPTIHVALLRILGANREKKFRSVFDARKTSYVLDPESNLSGTKGRLLPYLETFNERNGNLWQSAVGKIPPSSFITEGIRKETGLFLYFGHGGGQKYISRKDIEYLKESLSRPLSSVILMGCSSGKLESVNIRGSAFLGELPIQYEPEGIALSLLLAGSPCVVGNLWDVTDRDIDRFSIFLLEQLFGSDINCSIARSVAHVRKACKMRYIVGSSPVCYGFPVFPGS